MPTVNRYERKFRERLKAEILKCKKCYDRLIAESPCPEKEMTFQQFCFGWLRIEAGLESSDL